MLDYRCLAGDCIASAVFMPSSVVSSAAKDDRAGLAGGPQDTVRKMGKWGKWEADTTSDNRQQRKYSKQSGSRLGTCKYEVK